MYHVYEKVFQNTPAMNLALVVGNHNRRADTHATTATFIEEQKKKKQLKVIIPSSTNIF